MAFDIMNLFEETENIITELDEGNELAAVDLPTVFHLCRPRVRQPKAMQSTRTMPS